MIKETNPEKGIHEFIRRGREGNLGVTKVPLNGPFYTREFWGYTAFFPEEDGPGMYLLTPNTPNRDYIHSLTAKIALLEIPKDKPLVKVAGNTDAIRQSLVRQCAESGLPSLVLATGDLSRSGEGIVLFIVQGTSPKEALEEMKQKTIQERYIISTQ